MNQPLSPTPDSSKSKSRRRWIWGLSLSILFGVIGVAAAIVGLALPWSGKSQDMKSGPVLMWIGIGVTVVAMLAVVMLTIAALVSWFRKRQQRYAIRDRDPVARITR